MRNREQTIESLNQEFDCVIIGGGINGAVSAAALSAHGLRVALFEANDFASMTSQESSNMVWGGIKYLQDYEFGLVWKLCKSRNQLLKHYPNRISQIPFLAVIGETSPFSRGLGFIGSLAYWFFGRFVTQPPKVFSNAGIERENSLLDLSSTKGAIQYNDAILLDNDARFVYEFVKTAANHGATTLNYFEVSSAEHTSEGWQISVKDKISKQTHTAKAKVLVNAAGPLTRKLNDKLQIPSENQIVISKGVHLVVPRIETNEKVFAFFDESGRLFYVLPMHDRTVIGTTDTSAEDESVKVTDADREFLLNEANRCLNLTTPLTTADIISERCGVRPLVVKDASSVEKVDWISLSRKHVVEVNKEMNSISVFGGKLTDCINVGHEVVQFAKSLGLKTTKAKNWFGEESSELPLQFLNLVSGFHKEGVDEIAKQLWRRHGKSAFQIVENWKLEPQLSDLVFPGLYFTWGELKFIAENEQVCFAEDLLRRRTPISLLRQESEIDEAKFHLVLGDK